MKERRRPISDPEVLELLEREPELLAVADAIWATHRKESRPVARRIVLPAAAAAASLAIVAFVPWNGGEGGLTARALAAVGNGRVIHVVVSRDDQSEVIVDLASGAQRSTSIELESWFDSETGELRTVTRRNGVDVADSVRRRSGPRIGSEDALRLQLDPVVVAFVRGYRGALASGEARLIADGELAGAPVVRVEVSVGPAATAEVSLDAETYDPVAFRSIVGSRASALWRIREITSEPRADRDFAPRSVATAVVRGDVESEATIALAEAARLFDGRVLWAGARVESTSLAGARRQVLTRTDASGDTASTIGVEFTYGASTSDFVEIRQALEPAPAYGFAEGRLTINFGPIPPEGKVALTRATNGGREGLWLAQLRKRGLFIAIRGSSKPLVLEAARTLEPLPR